MRGLKYIVSKSISAWRTVNSDSFSIRCAILIALTARIALAGRSHFRRDHDVIESGSWRHRMEPPAADAERRLHPKNLLQDQLLLRGRLSKSTSANWWRAGSPERERKFDESLEVEESLLEANSHLHTSFIYRTSLQIMEAASRNSRCCQLLPRDTELY